MTLNEQLNCQEELACHLALVMTLLDQLALSLMFPTLVFSNSELSQQFKEAAPLWLFETESPLL